MASPLQDTFPIPAAVSDDEASIFTIGIIVMNGVRRSRIEWGESVAVFGLGLLGQLTARFAAICGARPVICIDTADPRLKLLPKSAPSRRSIPARGISRSRSWN